MIVWEKLANDLVVTFGIQKFQVKHWIFSLRVPVISFRKSCRGGG